MRYRILVPLLFGLMGCTSEAPVDLTRIDGPLTIRQATFIERMEPRHADCVEESQDRFGLSPAGAESFCSCQVRVFAQGMSEPEMDAAEEMTFGHASDDQATLAFRAVMRLLGVRKRQCGF